MLWEGNVINAFEALKYCRDEHCRKALEEINNSVYRARFEYCGVKNGATYWWAYILNSENKPKYWTPLSRAQIWAEDQGIVKVKGGAMTRLYSKGYRAGWKLRLCSVVLFLASHKSCQILLTCFCKVDSFSREHCIVWNSWKIMLTWQRMCFSS